MELYTPLHNLKQVRPGQVSALSHNASVQCTWVVHPELFVCDDGVRDRRLRRWNIGSLWHVVLDSHRHRFRYVNMRVARTEGHGRCYWTTNQEDEYGSNRILGIIAYRRATRYRCPSFSSSAMTQSVIHGIPLMRAINTIMLDIDRSLQLTFGVETVHHSTDKFQLIL